MNKEINEDKNNNYYYSLKFIIIGNQSVGKTNIINRFSKGEFLNNYTITLCTDFSFCNVEINEKIFKLQLWDTAGSERFHSITKGYYSNSACALIVYDITNKKSFDSVAVWIQECKNYTNNNIHLVLVGNKQDLNEKRKVSEEEGKALAKEFGMAFFESSALTGYNIDEIFYDSCRIINERIEKNVYDINDASNGIKIGIIQDKDNMAIDKVIQDQAISRNILLNKEKHWKNHENNKKCKC